MQSLLFWSAVTLYALATVAWFAWAAFGKEAGARAGRALLALGLLPHGATLAMRWVEVGHGPYNTRYEVISADTFILVAVWLAATVLARGLVGLGAFVAPAAFLLMGWSVSTFELKREVPIIFKSWWLVMHIGFAKLFFASILLAAACAAAWLVKDRRPRALASLPSKERLDLYAHQFTIVSFLFLGVMIVAGALWAHQSWGRYWGWDPIETSALVTWIVLAIVLHFRVLHRWSGERMAWLTFVALGFAVVTVFVVAILVPTIHNSYMVGS
ncbi:MAG TPA: cytochrome c biogenesis protein CcsA [Anaeromyxobacteraceae bacterium]|nr:cytochrome c biogenesis protein CcsA [Anaeromyxobacteraceae bacterium]